MGNAIALSRYKFPTGNRLQRGLVNFGISAGLAHFCLCLLTIRLDKHTDDDFDLVIGSGLQIGIRRWNSRWR